MVDPEDFRALTFDCYGTLIDWEGGIRTALESLPSLRGCALEMLVHDREEAERPLLTGPYRPYPEILFESLRAAAARQGRSPSDDEVHVFAASMERWRPFAETPNALRRMASRFSLAIVSNVETKTLSKSVEQLGVPFAALVTAEEIRSYKPARRHFDVVLERLGLPAGDVLHVGCSLFHDVRPARRLGWRAVWIDRANEQTPEDLAPSEVFPDLTSLANALGV